MLFSNDVIKQFYVDDYVLIYFSKSNVKFNDRGITFKISLDTIIGI